mmetsp:Transcript_9617/g.24244  ORF Transcript_9617/g.24244 Transcript_9617/m.24244 type:complete len:288 (+) Transcript_9617:924-1787(+)
MTSTESCCHGQCLIVRQLRLAAVAAAAAVTATVTTAKAAEAAATAHATAAAGAAATRAAGADGVVHRAGPGIDSARGRAVLGCATVLLRCRGQHRFILGRTDGLVRAHAPVRFEAKPLHPVVARDETKGERAAGGQVGEFRVDVFPEYEGEEHRQTNADKSGAYEKDRGSPRLTSGAVLARIDRRDEEVAGAHGGHVGGHNQRGLAAGRAPCRACNLELEEQAVATGYADRSRHEKIADEGLRLATEWRRRLDREHAATQHAGQLVLLGAKLRCNVDGSAFIRVYQA